MILSIVVDAIICIFFVAVCIMFAKKKLIISFLSALTLIVSITLGIFLAPLVRPLIMTEERRSAVADYCTEFLEKTDHETEGGLGEKPEVIIKNVSKELWLAKYTRQKLEKLDKLDKIEAAEEAEKEKEQVSQSPLKTIGNDIAGISYSIFSFFIVFVASVLILSLIRFISERRGIEDARAQFAMDNVGGVMFGIIFAFSITFVVTLGLNAIATLCHREYLQAFHDSYLCRVLYDYNPIGYLLMLVS